MQSLTDDDEDDSAEYGEAVEARHCCGFVFLDLTTRKSTLLKIDLGLSASILFAPAFDDVLVRVQGGS